MRKLIEWIYAYIFMYKTLHKINMNVYMFTKLCFHEDWNVQSKAEQKLTQKSEVTDQELVERREPMQVMGRLVICGWKGEGIGHGDRTD